MLVRFGIVLLLLAILPCASAQETPLPATVECSDVARPPGSLLPPYTLYEVGTNQHPYCYLPSDVTPPVLLNHPEPIYTGDEFFPGEAPPVLLSLFVSTEGVPFYLTVARAAGFGLDKMAIDVVKTWRWKPAVKNGSPVAVLNDPVQVKFELQGSSAKPYVEPPPSVNPSHTEFGDVDRAKYPLTVFIGAGGCGAEADGFRVKYDATLLPPAGHVKFLITCGGKNKNCSILKSANYPARWLSEGRELEILGKVLREDEWRAAEYDVEFNTACCSWPATPRP